MKTPYIEKTLAEEDVTYSKEELFKEIDQARADYKAGKLKVYETEDELFKALGI